MIKAKLTIEGFGISLQDFPAHCIKNLAQNYNHNAPANEVPYPMAKKGDFAGNNANGFSSAIWV